MIEWLTSSDEVLAALLVVALTPAVQILWLSGAAIIRRVREWRSRRIERCPIRLGRISDSEDETFLPETASVHCLFIRYGNDAYLEQLASDQEKFEGRLRLEVETIDLEFDRENSAYSGEIRLKVHRRLGTQFKLFCKVADQRDAERMAGKLRRLDGVLDVSVDPYGPRPRIWFLLKQYPVVTSTDGLRREGGAAILNNYYFPV